MECRSRTHDPPSQVHLLFLIKQLSKGRGSLGLTSSLEAKHFDKRWLIPPPPVVNLPRGAHCAGGGVWAPTPSSAKGIFFRGAGVFGLRFRGLTAQASANYATFGPSWGGRIVLVVVLSLTHSLGKCLLSRPCAPKEQHCTWFLFALHCYARLFTVGPFASRPEVHRRNSR